MSAMPPLKQAFQHTASDPSKPKRPAPLSVRLTASKRAQLEQMAGGMSLNAYVRMRLFTNGKAPRNARRSVRLAKEKALAKVLRRLGKLELSKDLEMLQWAEQNGQICLTGEAQRSIISACRDIQSMRQDLVKALGLSSSSQ